MLAGTSCRGSLSSFIKARMTQYATSVKVRRFDIHDYAVASSPTDHIASAYRADTALPLSRENEKKGR